ncbi:unnamed protein product [Dibothriocephalus latus]|uniref:Uncharacterized protein n=1 Tax=Dibothriocephalus latus TaxID=60516 RepID=A0A3P7R0P7_DIBLA|nr:unnamed protein product [Dibothriocephalus latus]
MKVESPPPPPPPAPPAPPPPPLWEPASLNHAGFVAKPRRLSVYSRTLRTLSVNRCERTSMYWRRTTQPLYSLFSSGKVMSTNTVLLDL